MQLKLISLGYERTFDLSTGTGKNKTFESLKIKFNGWFYLEDGEDPDQASITGAEFCKAHVRAQYNDYMQGTHRDKPEEIKPEERTVQITGPKSGNNFMVDPEDVPAN